MKMSIILGSQIIILVKMVLSIYEKKMKPIK